MKKKYDKQFGYWITFDNFLILFSNKYCDLNYLRSKKTIKANGKNFDSERMAICDQVHSKRFKILDRQDCGAGFLRPEIKNYDAMITDDAFIIPVVKSADCTPVILIDPVTGARAAIHSGREGTRKGVVVSTLYGLIDAFSANVDNIFAFIGPSIGVENYEVSEDIYSNFVKNTGIDQAIYRKLDIKKVIVSQLKSCGVKQDKIIMIHEDMFTNADFHSYRRDKTKGRQISFVAEII